MDELAGLPRFNEMIPSILEWHSEITFFEARLCPDSAPYGQANRIYCFRLPPELRMNLLDISKKTAVSKA